MTGKEELEQQNIKTTFAYVQAYTSAFYNQLAAKMKLIRLYCSAGKQFSQGNKIKIKILSRLSFPRRFIHARRSRVFFLGGELNITSLTQQKESIVYHLHEWLQSVFRTMHTYVWVHSVVRDACILTSADSVLPPPSPGGLKIMH